ncbi:MAG: rhodanese-like domain-containing protein [Granulosicoccus sp.]|nr:rhodanese-like domain-containing protein [Granulosicoccus sp.]
MSDSSDAIELLSPSDAWALMQSDPGVALIDVRSDMEFLMIGHPRGAVNVPWIDAPDWVVNENFVANVRKALLGRVSARGKSSSPVLLICRSGNRSRDAAEALARAGLSEICIVAGGFEGPLDDTHHRNTVAGWRFEGLPWEQC